MKTTLATFQVVKIRENNAAVGDDPLRGCCLLNCISHSDITEQLALNVTRKGGGQPDGEWMFGDVPITLGRLASLVLEPSEPK